MFKYAWIECLKWYHSLFQRRLWLEELSGPQSHGYICITLHLIRDTLSFPYSNMSVTFSTVSPFWSGLHCPSELWLENNLTVSLNALWKARSVLFTCSEDECESNCKCKAQASTHCSPAIKNSLKHVDQCHDTPGETHTLGYTFPHKTFQQRLSHPNL